MATIKSKADLKRRIKEALIDGTLVSSQVLNHRGEVKVDNEPAPVVKVQSNGFAMNRNAKISWIRLDQQDELWEFGHDDKVIVHINDTQFIITLHPPVRVRYKPTGEVGIVKSVNESRKTSYVVFNCDNNWPNYRDYTAAECLDTALEIISMEEFNQSIKQ